MNPSPLFLGIQQMLEAGRLTGAGPKFALDGVPFAVPGDNTIDTDLLTFGKDGFSFEMSKWGGRQVKGVEDLRASLLQKGHVDAAHALPQWFVRLEDVEKMNPKQEYTARENHVARYMLRAMAGFDTRTVAPMQEYTPRYHVKGTKEPEWRYLSSADVDIVSGGVRPTTSIPNHRIVVNGYNQPAFTAEGLTHWADKWTQDFLADPTSTIDY